MQAKLVFPDNWLSREMHHPSLMLLQIVGWNYLLVCIFNTGNYFLEIIRTSYVRFVAILPWWDHWDVLTFYVSVAKPLVNDGSVKSHQLSLAYDRYSLQKLEPPLVLQEFVNHGMHSYTCTFFPSILVTSISQLLNFHFFPGCRRCSF